MRLLASASFCACCYQFSDLTKKLLRWNAADTHARACLLQASIPVWRHLKDLSTVRLPPLPPPVPPYSAVLCTLAAILRSPDGLSTEEEHQHLRGKPGVSRSKLHSNLGLAARRQSDRGPKQNRAMARPPARCRAKITSRPDLMLARACPWATRGNREKKKKNVVICTTWKVL